MLKTINAIIFDMDGVIFDSEKVYYDAFFAAADKNEVEATDEFVYQFAGKTTEACQLILQNHFNNDFDKTHRFFKDWGEARLSILAEHGLDFKEGFLPLFDAIKKSGRDIGLVTSANRLDMEDNFKRNNSNLLDKFSHIISIEDVKFPKPDPQPYRMMMRHLNHDPAHCVIIEDSLSGVNAAVASGANTIMINGYLTPPTELEEKLLFRTDHHDDILAFLQNNGL